MYRPDLPLESVQPLRLSTSVLLRLRAAAIVQLDHLRRASDSTLANAGFTKPERDALRRALDRLTRSQGKGP